MTINYRTETWVEVGAVEDITPLGSRVFRHPEHNIAIIRAEDDKIFAIENSCPHKQGPLSEGIVHGCRVTCPLHNWVIELDSGEAVAPDEGKVKTWPVRVDNGVIFVKLES